MVEIDELGELYETFRQGFADIIEDFNNGVGALGIDEIESIVKKCNFYQKIREYLEERDWKVVSEDFGIEVKKDNKVQGIPILDNPENTLRFPNWSRILEGLEDLEEHL